jgi:hypothetical protein
MKRTAAFALAALSVTAPLAAGCTRTSDGSIVMRGPSLSGLLHYGADDEEPARIVPSRTLPRQTSQPLATSLAVARPARQPTVSIPSVNIARTPPFRRADPAKPLSCTNAKTAEGRIHVVCT